MIDNGNLSTRIEKIPSWMPNNILLKLRILLIALSVSALFACGNSEQETANKNALERIQSTGVVRVGYANEAPYAYLDNTTGKVTGEAPEILRVIMQRLGVTQVEAVLTEFGSLIPGLKAGRFDVIAAGMYITPTRCREISFSEPTYGIGEAFLVRAGNPLGLHSYKDIANHPEARIGVVAGTVERAYARATGISDTRIAVLPDNPSAVSALQAGRIDVFAGTALTVQDLLTKMRGNELERATPFSDPIIEGKKIRGYGAFGFRKEEQALRVAFNKHLKTFIGSVEHRSLVQPFGFTQAELPGSVSAEKLCGR